MCVVNDGVDGIVVRQRLKDEVETQQDLVNGLQNMVVVVDETNENSADDGESLLSRRHTSQKLLLETCTKNSTQVHHSFLHQKMADKIVDAAAASEGSYINDLFSMKSISLLISSLFHSIIRSLNK